MEAIILAGGFGTRLRTLVSDVPKSMARIRQRPFLEYLFDYLLLQGISRVVLSTGYRHELISGHFGTSYKDLEIDYAVENEPMGTGGGIRLAMWKIEGKRALVLNGDTMFRVDYRDMETYHVKKRADATLALRKLEDTGRFGKVALNHGRRITGFEESGHEGGPGLVNGGVYILEKMFLMDPSYRGHFSMEKDCFERSYRDLKLYGWPSDSYFIDIGIPEDYMKAQHEFGSFAD